MGVPKFYRWVSERYPLTLHKVVPSVVPDVDNFYLDANGILHNCARPKDSQEPFPCQYPSEEEIFLETFNYIDMLFSMIRPKRLVYIAIDGVAPRAKMNQQRARRFRTATDRTKEMENRLQQGKPIPQRWFDSNCITPGTRFMARFSEALEYLVHKKITEDKSWASVKVILSTTNAPGEGEHKIIEYIRRKKLSGDWEANLSHCLYGLDADLIMLSLVTHEPHFILLRERTDLSKLFASKKGNFGVEATPLDRCISGEFEFFSIGVLREYLDREFCKLPITFYNLENCIHDFIFMCFLVGNDFLPQLPTLNIAEGALDTMLTLYKKLLPLFGGYLIENGNIVMERLEIFLSKLGLLERLTINRRLEAIAQSKGRPPRMVDIGTGHDGLWGLENDYSNENAEDYVIEPWTKEDIDQLLNEAYLASTDPLMESIKQSYYRDKLHIDRENKDSLEQLKFTYIKGLIWTWKYYCSGCPSWRWYYPYHYAPMASDLVGLNWTTNISDFSVSEPFLPFQQLLAVLPPQSAWCLPTALQRLMIDKSSPIHSFYPSEFEVDMDGKRNSWEGVVKLPFVDEAILLKAYYSIPNEAFSEEERRRNACQQTMIYRRHNRNEKNFGRKIQSPFPNHLRDIEETAAVCEPLNLPVIDSYLGFEPQLFPGTCLGASSPGNYPTLKTLSFSIYYAKIGVNVFGIPSKRETVIVKPQANQDEKMTTLNILMNGQAFYSPGKRVLVEYPWRCEALVWSVIVRTGEKVFKLPGTSELSKETVDPNFFSIQLEQFRKQALSTSALDIGEVEFLVGVHLCDKRDPSSGAIVSYCNEEVWLPVCVVVPIDFSTRMNRRQGYITSTISELNKGDWVVYIGEGPHFGRTAAVVSHIKRPKNDSHLNSNWVKIKFLNQRTLEWNETKMATTKDEEVTWFSLSQTAELLKSTPFAVSRITSSVFVKPYKSNDRPEDIGLRLKFVSKSLYVPGYCRLLTPSNSYEFSQLAVQVLFQYKQKFPQVFEILESYDNLHDTSFQTSGSKYIDMGADSEILIPRIKEWLHSLEIAKLPLLHSSSEVMSKEEIANVEQKLKRDHIQTQSGEFLVVPRELLLFGDEHEKQRNKTNLACIQRLKENVCLRDRVVNISATGPVPFGFQGTVVGIHGTELEVVFDEPFPAGTDLHHRCPAYRGKMLSRNTVLKLHSSKISPLKNRSRDLLSFSKESSRSGHGIMLNSHQRSKRIMNVQTPRKPLFLNVSKPRKPFRADSLVENDSQLTNDLSKLCLNDNSVQNGFEMREKDVCTKEMTAPDISDPVKIWEKLQEKECQVVQPKLNPKSQEYRKFYQRVYKWRPVQQQTMQMKESKNCS
ncbi:hypothetical protein GpartN1_g1682.t1 [Galdieria partita]|uniref:5'-3' exoribonuclease 1 n=1 Tax=Galdieria partita TaxID=83374 RepID=A0A9C7PT20_9RHOD|nr:hypothetical protein GpartN1_g1682.t1 [Galdieria partita]